MFTFAFRSYTRFYPQQICLPIITKVKFVTAVKFHYRVLQLTAAFLTNWPKNFLP